jgi:hypothetical protein
MQVGVFSDYPVIDKLKALDLLDRIPVALCATDPAINAFKPHPKGFSAPVRSGDCAPKRYFMSGIVRRLMPLELPLQACLAPFFSGGSASGHSDSPTDYGVFSSFEDLEYALANSC